MWRALVVVVGLFVGGASAAPPSEAPESAGPFGKADPIEAAKDKIEEKKSQEELEREARLEKLRAAQSEKQARVVVLQWQDSDVDYRNETLRRNIKTRIARPTGKFYPDVDLYQAGRKEPDATLRPLDQRATVPAESIDTVMAAVRQVEAIPWNALSETDWGIKAYELKDLTNEIWFVDRVELRQPLFLLYVQIGRAAENSNNPTPPFFEEVAGVGVNYYWYLAAAMASREPSLMAELTDPDMYQNVDNIKQQIEGGQFDPMTLNFEVAGKFNAELFTNEYKVFFNGLEDQITNQEALYDVPPGMMDVYLQRADGHSMSVRVEAVKLDKEEIYGVRDQARKRMGLDFIKQLMKNPEQCIPEVDGDILNYLAIYQKLHPGAEIYIAIPVGGSVHKILLWRWVPEQGTLIRINDNTGGFPVRFVALIGSGLTFSGLTVSNPLEDPTLNPDEAQALQDAGEELQSLAEQALKPKASSLPISYELRGHWGRLMVGIGLDFAVNLQDGVWREIPQSRTRNQVIRQVGTPEDPRFEVENDTTFVEDGQGDRILVENTPSQTITVTTPVVIERQWQRGAFLTTGVVFGKDAAYGFGPRVAARTGWYNAPHAVDMTAHVGWSIKPPLGKNDKTDSRVYPVIDTDIFGGIAMPFRDSIFLLSNKQAAPGGSPGDDGQGYDYLRTPDGSAEGSVWAPLAAGGGSEACIDATCKFRRLGPPLPAIGFTIKAGLTF
ncbi:MAG: hypothetical protein H6737_08180 [Alphaproteobacteria bacterium]|nr:hypothetical protein [Alphaproteobacteria bacterium]